jgi:hypothetical protein
MLVREAFCRLLFDHASDRNTHCITGSFLFVHKNKSHRISEVKYCDNERGERAGIGKARRIEVISWSFVPIKAGARGVPVADGTKISVLNAFVAKHGKMVDRRRSNKELELGDVVRVHLIGTERELLHGDAAL